jgi:addiction module HigA family antidote
MTNGAFVSDSSMATLTTSRSRIIIEARENMSISNSGIRRIRPTQPGEMLREDFMPDYGLTVTRLAQGLGVSRQSVNEILRGRRAVSSEMALRLSRLFGNSPEFWLNAQRAVDLWEANRAIGKKIRLISPLNAA